MRRFWHYMRRLGLLLVLLAYPVYLSFGNTYPPAKDITYDASSFPDHTKTDVQKALDYLGVHIGAGINWGQIQGTISNQTDLWNILNTKITGVNWGDIQGLLSNQSDLQTAFNAKLNITDAASTYQTLANFPSSSVDNELPLYSGTGGKTFKRASGNGFVKAIGGVVFYDNSTYVPTSRTLTINGTTYDLSDDRSWTITAGVWGQITGNLSDQTDLQNALDAKGTGNVSTVSVVSANGVSGTVANPTTTPAITIVPFLYSSGINWNDVNNIGPINKTGINWANFGFSSGFMKWNGSNPPTQDTNTYLTGNQTLTMTGDVSGSGTTAITTTIGALKVQTGMVNWASITNSEIQRAGINWASLVNDIKSSGINWANVNGLNPINTGGINWASIVNQEVNYKAINWMTIPSYTDTYVVTADHTQTAGVKFAAASSGANPGGAVNSIQYQVNGTTFGGFGSWDSNILTIPGELDLISSLAGQINLYEPSGAGSFYTGFIAPPSGLASSHLWILPTSDANGCLASNGSLTLSFISCLTGNQTITLSGAVSGSGATSIVTTLANNIVQTANVNWSSINGLGTINTGSINWTDLVNGKLFGNGINWNDVNGLGKINSGGINWTDVVNQTINTSGINWSKGSGYTSTYVWTATSAGGANWQAPSGGSMTWPSGGAGIPNYSGSSSWGTTYGVTGSASTVQLNGGTLVNGNLIKADTNLSTVDSGITATSVKYNVSGFIENNGGT